MRIREKEVFKKGTELNKIFDCFLFFNELEILSIRLKELYDVVHRFVIIEAPVTHQGKPKPLYFQENSERFRTFSDKIHHVVVRDMPEGEDNFQRENYQRHVLRGAITDALADDLIVVSDVDEIPNISALQEAAQRKSFLFLEMGLHYYFLNLTAGPWIKAYCAPKSTIDRMEDLSLPRRREINYLTEFNGSADTHLLRNAGWHLTWQLGVEAIMAKLDAFSHSEFRCFRQPDRIRRAMVNRRFFIGGEVLDEVPLRNLPNAVQKDVEYHRAQGHFAPPLPPLPIHWFDLMCMRFEASHFLNVCKRESKRIVSALKRPGRVGRFQRSCKRLLQKTKRKFIDRRALR
jgi:hypothetical protein